MSDLNIVSIEKKKNLVEYNYTFDGEWKKYLYFNNSFWIEYDFDVSSIPESILIVPFIANILPISWVFDLNINVENLDKSFYDCIEDVKNGYQNMYSDIQFKGRLNIRELVTNTYKKAKSGLLFSGGVDAVSSLISNIKDKPDLITICGSDIRTNNDTGWKTIKDFCGSYANKFNLKHITLKSNFRETINYSNLNIDLKKINNLYEWWHEMQHGLSLITLAAPIAFKYKYEKLYIASSYTPKDIGLYYCASDPTIDNKVKFCSCEVIHDGYTNSRVDKLKNITQYAEKNKLKIQLRVCWISDNGKNCCDCEKCHRTMLALMSIKRDPKRYGFSYNDEQYKRLIKSYKNYFKYDFTERHNNYVLYDCIQKSFIDNYKKNELPKGLEGITRVKIHKNTPRYALLVHIISNKAKNFLCRVKKVLKGIM